MKLKHVLMVLCAVLAVLASSCNAFWNKNKNSWWSRRYRKAWWSRRHRKAGKLSKRTSRTNPTNDGKSGKGTLKINPTNHGKPTNTPFLRAETRPYFKVNSYKTRTTDVYEYHDYTSDKRLFGGGGKTTWEDMWNRNVERSMNHNGMTTNDAKIYHCVDWNMQEARKQLVKLATELGFGGWEGELKYQCPYMYQYTDQWRYTYPAVVAAIDPKSFKEVVKKRKRSIRFPTGSNDKLYTCREREEFKTFTNGGMTNCFICMFEQKLTERKTHNEVEKKTQHHLLHALKVAKKSYKVYDECQSTMKCHGGKCRLDLTKCDLNEAMQFNQKIYKVRRFFSTFYWKTGKNYCKRLANMANLKPSLKKFLKGATYKSGQEICQPTEHMNLYKENAVDIHVNTNAKELTFKITDGEEKAFLSAKNMQLKVRENKLGEEEQFVTVVYDCTKNGVAHKRCEASRELPECTTEKTTNTIEVSNERGVLMSTCTVWVKGVKYGLSCEDSGSKRRRRLLQGSAGGES